MQKALHTPLKDTPTHWIEKSQRRVEKYFERTSVNAEIYKDDRPLLAAFDTLQANPYRLGEYFYELGLYSRAIEAFSACHDTDIHLTFAMAKALRADGRHTEALQLLNEVVTYLPDRTEPLQEDYTTVERYVTNLAHGGILLVHCYTTSHHVQCFVDELLKTSRFSLIAQANDLVALEKKHQEERQLPCS